MWVKVRGDIFIDVTPAIVVIQARTKLHVTKINLYIVYSLTLWLGEKAALCSS